jgi:hypothetical protein
MNTSKMRVLAGRGHGIKGRVAVALLLVLFAAGYGSVTTADAATLHRPLIGQAHVSRSTLPATGASAHVSVRVRFASRCAIYANRTANAAGMPLLRVVSCGLGHARFTLPAVKNGSSTPIHVHFRVVAKGRGGTARRTFYIAEKGSPPPPDNNWAGYIGVSSAPVTTVTATFTVPTLDCGATPSGSETTWDGIGGAKHNEALIQTGVESDCINGVQQNVPWWEIARINRSARAGFQQLPRSGRRHHDCSGRERSAV